MTWFPCHDCGGRVGLLIRGACRWCEPELHAEHEEQLARVERAMLQFKAQTGQDALSDYNAFARWCGQ